MEIRFANKKDAGEISKVYQGWSKFKGILPDELIEHETKGEIFSDISSKNKKYIIAIVDGEIIGACYIEISFIKLQTIRLGNMLVKEKYRGKGIALGLINKIKEFALENNVKKIWLWTQEELIDAIKCYEKNGFKLEGKQKSQFCGKDVLLYGFIL
ncbi:GNAT family N-acetyltransferase [archaeon]|nr:GNAT family N-acetyltransferase [archaeon]